MPQGSPLSPLLSNILLDDFDKELERRGHRFWRYADDANVYVQSKRAGLQVMASLTRLLDDRLRVKVNPRTSVVDRLWNGTFLSYTVTHHRQPCLKPAPKSVKRAKDRICQITHRSRGRNIRVVIEESNRFTRGWVGSCRLASGQHQFDTLDQWRRRRLRKILWEQWRTPKTRRRKLIALGLEAERARKATATGLGPGGMLGLRTCTRQSTTASLPHEGSGAFSINIGPCSGPHEPPCTAPYVRWCGVTGRATFPPTR
jgi:RNA-directed DNA polymerase